MSFQTLISCTDLHQLIGLGKARVLDCRFTLADTKWGRQQYRAAHIPGSVYAHLDEDLSTTIGPGTTGRHPLPDPEVFARTLSGWGIGHEDQVVVYDQSHGGVAARAWWMLQWIGHEKAALLDGGWAAWTNQEYPVTQALPDITESNYAARPVDGLTVDAMRVNSWRTSEQHCVVDARAHVRYLGEMEPIDPVAGHIPGAINLPFMDNVHPDGAWKSPDILRTRFEKIKDFGAGNTAFHCGSGVTGCHDILAYKHAGLGMPLLYPGSWSEWITDPNRPVARGPN